MAYAGGLNIIPVSFFFRFIFLLILLTFEEIALVDSIIPFG